MKRKLAYFILSAVCFISCLLIVKFFPNTQIIRGFVGDILIVLFMYFMLSVLTNIKPLRLMVFILVFAFVIEFLQAFKLIDLLKLEDNIVAQWVLGSVFDPLDFMAYAMGTFSAYFADIKVIRRFL